MDEKTFAKQQEAIDCALKNKNEYVFAYAYAKRGYQYISTTHERFAQEFNRTPLKKRFFHELTMSDRPIRLYFDVDYKFDGSDNDNKFRNGYSIAGEISEIIGIMLGDECRDPIVFDGSDDSKMSMHILFDIAFKDKDVLLTFMDDFSNRARAAYWKETIDYAVYNKNHLFRTIGSIKHDSTRMFTTCDRIINGNVVMKSLVHFIPITALMLDKWSTDAPRKLARRSDVDLSNDGSWFGWTQKMINSVQVDIVETIKENVECKVSGVKWKGNRLMVHLRGVICPNKGRAHKNNGASATITIPWERPDTLFLHIRIICMDRDCMIEECKYREIKRINHKITFRSKSTT